MAGSRGELLGAHRRGGVLVAHRLWDFQANVDGAKVAFEGVQPIVEGKDPDLATELETRFAELQTLVDSHRVGDGFKYYDELTPDEVKALSDAVNTLSEPLSRLTAAVLS